MTVNNSNDLHPSVDRPWARDAATFVVLVGCGVALRLACHDLPNFAPVAALALFAGYYFRSALVAICVPISVMLISDWYLGGYSWAMMALVYGMLAMPVVLRGWLRQTFRLGQGNLAKSLAPVAGLVACGLVSSILFFLVTNFGVWLWFGNYEPGLNGLWHCYVAAIPFFRYTLTGDLFFAVLLFGSYALALTATKSRVAVPEAR